LHCCGIAFEKNNSSLKWIRQGVKHTIKKNGSYYLVSGRKSFNPVEEGFVRQAEDWKHSSARNSFE